MKLWLFLVEGNSDKIYVDKIIKYYVKSEKLKKEIKLEWIILDGKYNYDKKEKQIKQKTKRHRDLTVIDITETLPHTVPPCAYLSPSPFSYLHKLHHIYT